MKKNTIILLLVAALCVAYFNNSSTGNPSGSSMLQPEPAGFENPLVITDADAWASLSQFKILAAKAGFLNTGGVITTTALEQLIARPGCNAIAFRFCVDTTGRLAPANSVFLVLGSVEMRNVSGQFVTNDIAGNRFASRHWCPPSCMKFVVENPVTRQMETVE